MNGNDNHTDFFSPLVYKKKEEEEEEGKKQTTNSRVTELKITIFVSKLVCNNELLWYARGSTRFERYVFFQIFFSNRFQSIHLVDASLTIIVRLYYAALPAGDGDAVELTIIYDRI